MKKKWLVLMVMAGLIVLSGLQPAAYGAGKNKIHFGYLVADQVHNFAAMNMKEKKFLEEEGLEVKWGEYLAGAYLMQHMASGEVDFGTCGIVPAMITRGQGIDVVILAGGNTEGSGIVVKNEIKTPKDLDGKSIGTPGIGSIQDAMVDMVARKYNISIKKRQMSVPDMPIFLKKGEIDGFIAWAPHNEMAEHLGYGHIILTSADILPGHQCCVLVAKGQLLKEEPELVRKVIRAFMKSYQYEQKHHDETIDLVVKYTNTPKDVVKTAWSHTPHPYPPYVNVENAKMQADGLIAGGKIQKDKVKDVDKFVAEMYHPEFLKEYMEKSK
jgi:NitT/TauT family transport system substrate-binding protein